MPRKGFLSIEQHFPYFSENPDARKRFVGIGCCGSKKAKTACEARSMYRGNYTMTCNKWIERNCEDWVILSAKHFVLDPDEVIEPYDLSLHDGGVDDKWARKVSRTLKKRFPGRRFICLNSHYGKLLDLGDLTLVFECVGKSFGSQDQTTWLKYKDHLVLDDRMMERLSPYTKE